MRRYPASSLSFAASIAFVMISPSLAADFPEFDKLASNKEMPDPLVMLDGTRVTTTAEWNEKRKPELKALFQYYMYGEIPPAPQVATALRRADRDVLGGKATMK